jgi:hypothetical protein
MSTRNLGLALLLALLGPGCQKEGSMDECSPGSEGCACLEGKCIEGLSCLSNLCVDNSAGSSGSSSSGGMTSCLSSKECGPEEVCYQQECADAWGGFTYDVKLREYEPTQCFVDEFCFDYYVEFDRMSLDPEAGCRSDCPVTWPGVSYVSIVPTEEEEPFQLSVLVIGDLTAATDAHLCWSKDDPGALILDCYPSLDDVCDCGPVPKAVLHDGQWKGHAYDAYFDVEFTLRK